MLFFLSFLKRIKCLRANYPNSTKLVFLVNAPRLPCWIIWSAVLKSTQRKKEEEPYGMDKYFFSGLKTFDQDSNNGEVRSNGDVIGISRD